MAGSSWAKPYDPEAPKARRKTKETPVAAGATPRFPAGLPGLPGRSSLSPRPLLPTSGRLSSPFSPLLSPASHEMPARVGSPSGSSSAVSPRQSPVVFASTMREASTRLVQAAAETATAQSTRAASLELQLAAALKREQELGAQLEAERRERRAGVASAREVMGGAAPRRQLHPILVRSLSRRSIFPIKPVNVGDLIGAPKLRQDSMGGRAGSNLLRRPALRWNPAQLPPIPTERLSAEAAGAAVSSPVEVPLVTPSVVASVSSRPIKVTLTTHAHAVRAGHTALSVGMESRVVQRDRAGAMPRGACPSIFELCDHYDVSVFVPMRICVRSRLHQRTARTLSHSLFHICTTGRLPHPPHPHPPATPALLLSRFSWIGRSVATCELHAQSNY